MSTASRSPIITVMSAAAIKAGRGLLRDFNEVDHLQISRKGTANFVTAADVRTEKLLQKELAKARPQYGFLMEEGGEIVGEDKDTRWIIDPIDGTNNFIHAVPHFCISIALEKRINPKKSEIVAGVVYDPIHNELYTAELYKGAFLNDRRIQVSNRKEFDESLFATTAPRKSRNDYVKANKILKALTAEDIGVRCNGAAALDLAFVAAGRYEGCWYTSLQPWDMAAGLLLVQEAGGLISTSNENAHVLDANATILASNKVLHSKISAIIASV